MLTKARTIGPGEVAARRYLFENEIERMRRAKRRVLLLAIAGGLLCVMA